MGATVANIEDRIFCFCSAIFDGKKEKNNADAPFKLDVLDDLFYQTTVNHNSEAAGCTDKKGIQKK